MFGSNKQLGRFGGRGCCGERGGRKGRRRGPTANWLPAVSIYALSPQKVFLQSLGNGNRPRQVVCY